MAGPKHGPRVTWLAAPLESERHAYRTTRSGEIDDRAECGWIKPTGATDRGDAKAKCRLCRYAASRP